jgi:hypothetical protein
MAKANANGIQIEYETFGNPSGRPLLLIVGLGEQMIHWDDDLCEDFAERGHLLPQWALWRCQTTGVVHRVFTARLTGQNGGQCGE